MALLLGSLAAANQTTTPAAPATPPPETTVVVEVGKWPVSTANQHFHLWVPEHTPVVKGLLAFVFHGCGQEFAENASLRALAAELACAVVGFDKTYGYPGHVQRGVPSDVLLKALAELATAAGRPEVEHAPILTFGHSNATMFAAGFASQEPQRTIAWIAFKSAFGGQFSLPEIYRIPGAVLSGEDDEQYFSDQLATVRKLRHQHRALLHMIVEPGGGHGPMGQASYTILLAFIKTAFHARVPAAADPRQGPVKLIDLAEASGWLGQTLDGVRVKPSLDTKRTWEQPVDPRRRLEIAPYADYPGDHGFASWFPTEEYARKWQQFCQNANLPEWAETWPPRTTTLEEWFAQAQRLEKSDPPAAIVLYQRFANTPFAEPAADRLQDPELIRQGKARELLKQIWVAEMTLQNPPRFGKFAADFHSLNAQPLATIAAAAATLLGHHPNTADATTARLLLERYQIPLQKP